MLRKLGRIVRLVEQAQQDVSTERMARGHLAINAGACSATMDNP